MEKLHNMKVAGELVKAELRKKIRSVLHMYMFPTLLEYSLFGYHHLSWRSIPLNFGVSKPLFSKLSR